MKQPALEPETELKWPQILLDAVFPPRCADCRNWGALGLCKSCERQLQPISEPLCRRCGLPLEEKHLRFHGTLCFDCERETPPFDAARSVFVFGGPIRQAIHRFKYEGQTALARPLAQYLADWWQQVNNVSTRIMPFAPQDIEAIIPIPLHSWRRWRRGYNQSELLTRELGRIFDLSVVSALQRTRYTVSQVELSEDERARNVRDAFTFNKKNNVPATALLIDDVFTTGATLGECARVLKNQGVKRVYALTLARQV